MILIDPRDGSDKQHRTSKELLTLIRRIGIPAELSTLPYGDFGFCGNGPKGSIDIGVERKTLHDMLNCIDDSRYTAHQKIGMGHFYSKGASFLLVEGLWKPHDPDGYLMEGFSGGASWGQCRYRSQRTPYSKLRRYLLSISLSGVHVMYTRDIVQTAFDVCEIYQYFQKRWEDHTSLIEVQRLAIADMNIKPPLVRKWANDIDDVGAKFSLEAQRLFRTPIALARADETEWMRIKGIGVKTAQKIVRQIWSK